jgi:hypothetical protein
MPIRQDRRGHLIHPFEGAASQKQGKPAFLEELAKVETRVLMQIESNLSLFVLPRDGYSASVCSGL